MFCKNSGAELQWKDNLLLKKVMRNVSVILVGLHLIINKPIDLSFIRHDRSFQGKLVHFEGLVGLVESSQ